MKIVHIITRLSKGGAEENTILSCRHQAQQGHDVYLFYGPDDLDLVHYRALAKEVADKIHTRCVPSLLHRIHPWHDLRGVLSLMRLLRQVRPDVVHTHTSKAGILGRLAAVAARVPAVVHGVHILPFNNVGPLAHAVYVGLEHLAAKGTDLFIHVSRGTLQAYAREGIGRGKPHKIAHSGMDVERYQTAARPEDSATLLGWSGTSPRPKVIVMLAALEPRKRHRAFIEGFAAATRPGQPIRLLLAGQGQEEAAIEEDIRRFGLEDRVLLLGHRADPERLVALADVGVLASLREGLPRVVVQYLAGGRPAVVSAIDGIDELIEEGRNGLIVQDPSAQEVAKAAVALVADEARLARMKDEALKSPVMAWSHEAMFAALDESYALLAKG